LFLTLGAKVGQHITEMIGKKNAMKAAAQSDQSDDETDTKDVTPTTTQK